VRDGRVSLVFTVPGESNVVRVNGRAIVTVDPGVLASFTQNGKHPPAALSLSRLTRRIFNAPSRSQP
jgi:predicted pyridoxine 5'-phosphate oxidase superfamily flavin-nucleotide-binding protein